MADRKTKGSEFKVESRTSLDPEALRQIVEILESSEVTKLIWANGDEKLIIRRGYPPAVVHQVPMPMSMGPSVVATPSPASTHGHATTLEHSKPRASAPTRAPALTDAASDKKGHIITSPFVGTFYRNPSPDQPPFCEAGSPVKKGQVLCIVEAMKLMNEIESEVSGKVTEIFVQNAQPVEFGQPLFRIEP